MILRESASEQLVRRHLAEVLQLSHQSSSHREGTALAVGVASTAHLEQAWAVLEHLGRTRFLRSALVSPDSQDEILKTSFLSASTMLAKALSREGRTQSYKFAQIPELIQCLLVSGSRGRKAELSRSQLRPRLKPAVKSRVLQTCLRSLYALPPTETLRSCLPPLALAPDALVTACSRGRSPRRGPWGQRKCLQIQHLVGMGGTVEVTPRSQALLTAHPPQEEAMPSMLGHQVGLLTLLWWDKDEVTRSHSRQCVSLLLQLLIQQKGELGAEFMHLNKMNFEARIRRESEMKFYDLVKALDENLTVAQHTQLVLTLLHGLCSHDSLLRDLASKLLLRVIEDHSIRPEQVAELLQGLFQELPRIAFKEALQTVTKAVTLLGSQHTQRTVEAVLTLCQPSERQVVPLWKALAANSRLARKVVTLLYMKLKLRPPGRPTLLQALGTLYELLYSREDKATVRWAFAGILLGLLMQLHYLFELDAVGGVSDFQEESLEVKALSPSRTCLEALKGLFWTTNHWEVLAHLKLLWGWELFERLETYTEGVTLLARAMAHYDCEVRAVLGQAIISLKSPEERDNTVAILIITELLSGQELTQHVSRKSMDSFLSLGLDSPSRLVRAMSLKGLSSALMHPKKVVLLRNQVTSLLDGFLKPEPKDLLGLMKILGDILHHLGAQGIGSISLKIAQHLLPLFEDVRSVRGGAIFLYGDVIYSGGKKFQQQLKNHAFQALVPLLLHLADSCPDVVMYTFLRRALLLEWEFRKELFGKLAWGRGLGAENDIFIYMVESNPGSYRRFLMQVLVYLGSPDRRLKVTAMKFIGRCGPPPALPRGSRAPGLRDFEMVKQDPDPTSRKFHKSFAEDIAELSQYVLL
uniref:Maestro heat-like repeat family member 5 n=1 Tax=Catagonus wagneri TaxID=51154 RepID=A0A8C3WJ20_9CETA